jgi:hypothetical protein
MLVVRRNRPEADRLVMWFIDSISRDCRTTDNWRVAYSFTIRHHQNTRNHRQCLAYEAIYLWFSYAPHGAIEFIAPLKPWLRVLRAFADKGRPGQHLK